jgi:hypothetical protein
VNGIQEVSGSIPLISTTKTVKNRLKSRVLAVFFFASIFRNSEKFSPITTPVTTQ